DWRPGPDGWTFGKFGNLGNGWSPRSRIILGGKGVDHGLSMHPPDRGFTRVCYALGRRARDLHWQVGFSEDEGTWDKPPTRFVILGDGDVKWRSPALRNNTRAPTSFRIDVSNIDILELRVYVEAEVCTGAHAVWIDPAVVVK